MGKFVKKDKAPKSRKEIRKFKRQEKKKRKFDSYVNRNKPGKFVTNPNKNKNNNNAETGQLTKKEKQIKKGPKQNKLTVVDNIKKELKKEKDEHKKLQKQMNKQRKLQLQVANDDEDRNIKQLEKHLKLNKRKSKSVPKSFAIDGLDYVLEVCNPENLKSIAAAEQQFAEANDDFDDDFALITGNTLSKKSKIKKSNSKNDESDSDQSDIDEEFSDDDNEFNDDSNSEIGDEHEKDFFLDSKQKSKVSKNDSFDDDEDFDDDINDYNSENSEDEIQTNQKLKKDKNKKRKIEEKVEINKNKAKNTKKIKMENTDEESEQSESKNDDFSDEDSNDELDEEMEQSEEENEDEIQEEKEEQTWEDIYGRTRSKDGEVLSTNTGKYVPPALRNKTPGTIDQKQAEKIARIRKQLKGLLNRLAESNMHSIASQVEEMYMSNSRNNMNETLTALIFEALISPVTTPERLLLEYTLLVTILHANVGTEVGAHFLQTIVKKFDELYNEEQPVENKELDNAVHTIAQLYNFKLFHSQLLYQILVKLSDKFEEKHVECILLVLKNVGFSLRKDNPLALKDLILNLQKKAATVTDNNSRVKFMLDILLAIKNNNVSKIPNYDTTYSEHLKKISKNFIRKGLYVTQLNISLEDLLKAEERGRWWIVGSAWTGNDDKKEEKDKNSNIPSINKKILELARKQRMNTDTRRNIFCALMTAENYSDAFEKILGLGLKGQQEREIIHVLLHCSLQEKEYNPYYSLIAQRFCEYDRKYQMMIRCSMWDKLKTLAECSGKQISILAKLLTYLFINQGLPISTLKVIQFSELDQITLRLIRQVLLGILLHSNEENSLAVFQKVALSPKLKMFRDSLRLFIHHFLLRNLSNSELSDDHKNLLTQRAKLAEKHLSTVESKIKF